MQDITITMTSDEAQYLLDAMDTHVKTHGLRVATAGVMILAKLQAAANSQVAANGQGTEKVASSEPEEM